MARTFKDKPYKVRNHDIFPFGLKTKWNDCSVHGKLCSHGREYNRKQILKKKNENYIGNN